MSLNLACLPGRKRILIVSDNVGAPIQPRGIYYYTTNLMRALHACGHELCLLVEPTSRYALPLRALRQMSDQWPHAARSARLASLYSHLFESQHLVERSPRRNLRSLVSSLLGWPSQALSLLSILGIKTLLRRRVVLPLEMVANDTRQLDFVPNRLAHLRTCSQVMLSASVYSLAHASSALGWGVPIVDARGFDVILVDTPSYFRFELSPGAEVVAVIHDLIPLSDPTMPRFWRRAFINKVGVILGGADSLIFASESTRTRFRELFPNTPMAAASTIMYPSIADDFADGAVVGAPQVRDRADESIRPYALAIVCDEPRKNIANLMSAWSLLREDVALKIVGEVDPARYPHSAWPGSRVELLGYVDDDTKRRLLAGAAVVIVPSFSEGFGIPIVEAMFFGTPVLCSDLPVFREVAGDHAGFFDPYSPASIAAAVRECLNHPGLYRARAHAGRELSRRRFSVSTLAQRVAERFGGDV